MKYLDQHCEFPGFSDLPPMQAARRKRSREREGAGKSPLSFIKHRILKKAAFGQYYSFRKKNPDGMIYLIDGNAGDGEGVPELEDLFEPLSLSTAALLCGIAEQDRNAQVILCEKDRQKRECLKRNFPRASVILDDNRRVSGYIGHGRGRWALWISDPNGPKDQGVDAMALLARYVPSDFLIVFNEGMVRDRLSHPPLELTGLSKRSLAAAAAYGKAQKLYRPMLDQNWWLKSLGRARLSRTQVYDKYSPSFKPRFMVAANYLSDGATREPFKETR